MLALAWTVRNVVIGVGCWIVPCAFYWALCRAAANGDRGFEDDAGDGEGEGE